MNARELERLLIRIVGDSSGARLEVGKAVQAVADAQRRMKSDLGAIDGGLRGLQRSIGTAFNMLAGYLSGRTLLNLGQQALQYADDLQAAADQIGLTTKQVQAFYFAAGEGDIGRQKAEQSLARFSQTLGEAGSGADDAQKKFRALGVAFEDAAGNARPTADVLVDVAERISGIEDPAQRAAAAVDFFGKGGARLGPLLEEVAGGFDDLTMAADKAGQVMSDETVTALADANREIEKLGNRITITVGGILSDISDAVDGIRTLEEVEENLRAVEALRKQGWISDEGARLLSQGGQAERSNLLDEQRAIARMDGRGVLSAKPPAPVTYNKPGGGGKTEAEKLADQLAKLQAQLNPAAAAMAEYEKQVALLSQAYAQGNITLAEYADLTARLDEHLQSKSPERAVATAREQIDAFRDETRALQQGKAAHEAYLAQKKRQADLKAFEDRIRKETAGLADQETVVRELVAAYEASNVARDDAQRFAEQQEEQLKRFADEVEGVSEDIADDLTTALFEGASNGFDDIFASIGKWMERIALEVLKQQIILPITTQLVGAVPGLFGISGGAGGNGFDMVGAVGSLATDAFDFIGRNLGFGPSAQSFASQYGTVGAARNFAPGLFDSVASQMGFGGFDLGAALGGAATGFGIGSLVGGFNLFGKKGPGASIGGSLGGLAGSLTGIPGLDLVGSLLGSVVGSLFGPGPSSGPFSYGTAHSQGGRLAYVGSSSLKGGVGDMAPLVNETTAVANQLADLFGAEFADNAVLRIGYIANEQGVKGYSVSGAGRKGTNDAFNNYKFFGENKEAAQIFAIEKAIMGGGFNGLSTGGGLQGIGAEERGYLGKSFSIRKTTEEVLKDAALIADLFGETEAAMSEAAIALRDLNQHYDAQIERARELGIAETELVRRRAEAIADLKSGFVAGIEDQILAITDPMAFALKQLDKEFESIRANAEDFGVGMVEVERLYGLKRQQVLEQIAQTSISDLQRFLEELKFGEISGASPGDRLAGSRAAFEAAAAQAMAGDAVARGRIQDLGSTFLGESRGYNASGSAYYNDVERVRQVVEALLGDVPGFAGGTLSAPGGLAWVGERGRELMALPRGAGILPNAISEALAGRAANGEGDRPVLRALLEGLTEWRRQGTLLERIETRLRDQGSAIARLRARLPAEAA
jgi:hypothetical protein